MAFGYSAKASSSAAIRDAAFFSIPDCNTRYSRKPRALPNTEPARFQLRKVHFPKGSELGNEQFIKFFDRFSDLFVRDSAVPHLEHAGFAGIKPFQFPVFRVCFANRKPIIFLFGLLDQHLYLRASLAFNIRFGYQFNRSSCIQCESFFVCHDRNNIPAGKVRKEIYTDVHLTKW